MIDKYVEFDAVILLLDVLLLRIQSYRHLIFNYDISSSVSILLVVSPWASVPRAVECGLLKDPN